MRTFDHEHLVTLEETNLVGNVYFAHYLRWQGHCRERFLAERAPGVLRSLRQDLALVTVSCQCDYFVELFAMDRVEIRMALSGVSGNRVVMKFEYFRVSGPAPELVARGTQTIACMRRTAGAGEPVEVPSELLRALEPYGSIALENAQ